MVRGARPHRSLPHSDKAKPRVRASNEAVMKFSHFFIDRPIFASVLSILFVLVGGLAIFQLPVAQYPDVAPPQVSEDGEMATVFAIPRTAPQDAKTSALLERLREDVIPDATAGTPLKVVSRSSTKLGSVRCVRS